ncbi:MAG: hypothetical protein AB8B47_05805 [Roseobacter sp.]
MIRPEAKAQILRWREALVGGAAALLGGWWLLKPGALFLLPGIALVIAGLALIWIGVQRARFRSLGTGPGTVQVDEGQITYFGPLTGGAVALRELGSLTYDPSLHPAHWRLRQPGYNELLIPVNADGAEALFDAFATLPGLKMEPVIGALKSKGRHPIVIWQSDMSISAQASLH